MSSKHRGLRVAAAAALASAGMYTAASLNAAPAASAATANAISAADLASMSLDDAGSFSTITALRDAVEASSRPLTVVSLDQVLSGGYSTRSICHPTDVVSTTTPTGFCWTTTDDTTGNWFPQGITGSGDAMNGSVLYPTCDTCAGRKIVAVSWHSGTAYTEWGNDSLARVSFVDVTNGLSGATYRHVLLVEPDNTSAGYHEIASHADGIMMYGNKLFLVTGGDAGRPGAGRVVRVFDLRHIWQMSSTSSGSVGCTSTACSAAYHSFALPEIGYYQFPDGNVCTPLSGGDPCFTSVSLDRSSSPDAMVTTEYDDSGAGGRILRWPLDGSTALLAPSADGLVHPVEGWSSPVWKMQGAVMTGSHGVIDGLCPNGAPAVSYMGGGTANQFGGHDKYCLHKFTVSADRSTLDVHYWTTIPENSENVSYWPSSGELWSVNEFKGDGTYPSDRLVLHWSCSGLTCS